MFPVLAGLGAAVLAYAAFGESEGGEVIPKPTQKPKAKAAKKSSKSPDLETAAQAHARATKERDDHWKGQIKTLKGNHKSALAALSDALKPEPADATPAPKPAESVDALNIESDEE